MEAEKWFVARRWPNGVLCVVCESTNIKTRKTDARRKTPVYHCNDCKKDFTVKTGPIMHDSRLPLGMWAMAFYLFSTNLKGVSSMKLHRDLGITQNSAWYLAHRIRETWDEATEKFAGPVEADETYVGGRRRNMHAKERAKLEGRGVAGKPAIAVVKDRETNQVSTVVVESTGKQTLQGFVGDRIENGAAIFTDDLSWTVEPQSSSAWRRGVCSRHGSHERDGKPLGDAKRGITGTYYHISPKHLDR